MALRRFLGSAFLAALAASGYAAPTAEKVQSTDDAAAEAVEVVQPPRTPRRRLVRAVPSFDYAVPVTNSAEESSTLLVTNPGSSSLEARVVVNGRSYAYTIPARSSESIPSSELGFAGDTVAFVDVAGQSDVAVSGRTERSSIVDGARRWTGSSTVGVPLASFLHSGEVSKSPLSAASYSVTAVAGRDNCGFGFKVLDENGGVRLVKDNYTMTPASTFTFDVATETGLALQEKDQLQLFPYCTMTFFITKHTANDRTTRTPMSGEDAPTQYDLPTLVRSAAPRTETPAARSTIGVMNAGVTQGTIRLNYTKRGPDNPTGGLEQYDVIASTHATWNDAFLDFFHFAPEVSHEGAAHGWTLAGTLLPYAELARTTSSGVVESAVPVMYENDRIGLGDRRGLIDGVTTSIDEVTRLGLLNRSGVNQDVTIDCYKDGAKTGTFTQQLTPYSNILVDNLAEKCGGDGLYLIINAGKILNETQTLHAWKETQNTTSLDNHIQAAKTITKATNNAPTFTCYDEMSDGTCDIFDNNPQDYILDLGLAVSTHSPYPRQGTMRFTDSDQDLLTYTWRNVTVPGTTLPLPGGWTSNGASFSYLPTTPGNIRMECTASDGKGGNTSIQVVFITPS